MARAATRAFVVSTEITSSGCSIRRRRTTGIPIVPAHALEGAADVNAVIANATTPLMKASHHGDDSIVRLLIAAGAEVNIVVIDACRSYAAMLVGAPLSQDLPRCSFLWRQ